MDELDNCQSLFWCLLVRWLWTVKTPLKMLATDAKNAKNQTRSEIFYDGQNFRRQCVNVIDRTWGQIYFSTYEHFGLKFRTRCAMTLSTKRWIAFSRCFYPKRLTIAVRLYIFISMCVPWESNPQPFALLTQCSTTEPHRNTGTQELITAFSCSEWVHGQNVFDYFPCLHSLLLGTVGQRK